jgi:hypothetical protein
VSFQELPRSKRRRWCIHDMGGRRRFLGAVDAEGAFFTQVVFGGIPLVSSLETFVQFVLRQRRMGST